MQRTKIYDVQPNLGIEYKFYNCDHDAVVDIVGHHILIGNDGKLHWSRAVTSHNTTDELNTQKGSNDTPQSEMHTNRNNASKNSTIDEQYT